MDISGSLPSSPDSKAVILILRRSLLEAQRSVHQMRVSDIRLSFAGSSADSKLNDVKYVQSLEEDTEVELSAPLRKESVTSEIVQGKYSVF